MHEGDGGDWLDGWAAIRVDIGSVQQLADALVKEVEGNLQPRVDRLFDGYAPGTSFGAHNPSLHMHMVRAKYHQCLTATVEQLAAYAEASSMLVAAAVELATRYRTADELSAARVEDVDRALSDAISAVAPVEGFDQHGSAPAS